MGSMLLQQDMHLPYNQSWSYLMVSMPRAVDKVKAGREWQPILELKMLNAATTKGETTGAAGLGSRS